MAIIKYYLLKIFQLTKLPVHPMDQKDKTMLKMQEMSIFYEIRWQVCRFMVSF